MFEKTDSLAGRRSKPAKEAIERASVARLILVSARASDWGGLLAGHGVRATVGRTRR